ncbi:hypothetical protein PU33_03865 [Escherichia coli]|nr:hypothetical protein PU33_03865 [Escherichia coli]
MECIIKTDNTMAYTYFSFPVAMIDININTEQIDIKTLGPANPSLRMTDGSREETSSATSISNITHKLIYLFRIKILKRENINTNDKIIKKI